MSALRRLRASDREIAFKPWIYAIAKNTCIDAFRRSRGREEVSFDARDALGDDEYGRYAEPEATPDSVVESKLAFDDFCGAFGGLSQTHHEILVLREFEGLSYREIGERLGLSRPAVESTLFRARRRLSEEYQELVSGERCLRVRRLVDAGGARATGLRNQRRLARHLAHCQPCRRYAGLAGVEVDAPARRSAAAAKAARIAALLPLPMLLRRRAGAEQAAQLLGHQASAPVAQWTASVAGVVDPALVGGWTKAVATAAAVAVAGVGAGAAITEPDALRGFVTQAPAVVPGSSPAGSRSGGAGSGAGDLHRSAESVGGRGRVVRVKSVTDRVRGSTASPGVVMDGAGRGRRGLGEPGRSDDLSSGPPSAPDRGASPGRSIPSLADRPDLAPPATRAGWGTRATAGTGTPGEPGTAGTPGRTGAIGGDTTGDGTMTRDRQEAIRQLGDKLRGDSGSAGAGADADGVPAIPTQGAAGAPQGIPSEPSMPPLPSTPPGATRTGFGPAATPIAPTPATHADTVWE